MKQLKITVTKKMCAKLAAHLILDPEDGTGYVPELTDTRKDLAIWLYNWFKKKDSSRG